MAFTADIHFHDLYVFGRTRFKRFAACADDGNLMVVGMNIGLHSITSLYGFIWNTQLLYFYFMFCQLIFGGNKKSYLRAP